MKQTWILSFHLFVLESFVSKCTTSLTMHATYMDIEVKTGDLLQSLMCILPSNSNETNYQIFLLTLKMYKKERMIEQVTEPFWFIHTWTELVGLFFFQISKYCYWLFKPILKLLKWKKIDLPQRHKARFVPLGHSCKRNMFHCLKWVLSVLLRRRSLKRFDLRSRSRSGRRSIRTPSPIWSVCFQSVPFIFLSAG